MLAWVSGRKQADVGRADETFLDAPETPAPVFAVRAFKQAIWGTPKTIPDDTRALIEHTPAHHPSQSPQKPAMDLCSRPSSPTKSNGILMTPGTTAAKRKQVTFSKSVTDNEGKKTAFSRSGLPSTCPGKFPSPWTPRAADVPETGLDITKTSTTNSGRAAQAAIAEAIPTKADIQAMKRKEMPTPLAKRHETSKPTPATRAKDDTDITIDLMTPRSESGRYWRDQYMSYSAASEDEVRKLIAKAKLAKEYARRKDEEAMELRLQLESEKKRRMSREKSLEKQVRDLRERLRQVLGENARSAAEVGTLRQQVQKLVNSAPLGQSSPSEPINTTSEQDGLSDATTTGELESSHIPKRPAQREHRQRRRADLTSDSVQPRARLLVDSTDLDTLPMPPSPTDSPSRGHTHQDGDDKSTMPKVKRTQRSPVNKSATQSVLAERHAGSLNARSNQAPGVTTEMSRTPRTDYVHKSDGQEMQLLDTLFDASAPLEALAAQADQPVTPARDIKKVKEPAGVSESPGRRKSAERRHRNKDSSALDQNRINAARARIAARRKAGGKENGPIR